MNMRSSAGSPTPTPAPDAERRTYVAIAPDGTEFRRRSARAYTHAIIVQARDGDGWRKIGFAGSLALATACSACWDKSEAAYEARRAREAGIAIEGVPVRRSLVVPALAL